MKSKSIIIVNQDSGYLMIDLANAYESAGYDVRLITGRLVERDKALSQNIKLSRIIKYNRSSTLNRLFTWFIGFVQIFIYLLFLGNKKHLLLVSNPPFSLILTLFFRNPFSLLIYDIYPDSLTEFGFFSKDSYLIKWWERSNKRIFPKANRIITLTPGMKSVVEKYSGSNEVEVIPIWTDNNFLKPKSKQDNPFIERNFLKGKFVILYSGNLGYTHDVEVLVDLAIKTKDKDIQFVIIGDGDKKDLLEKKITDSEVTNCLLLPFQPPNDLPYSLSSADIAVVTLGKDASKLSVPSKTYNLMSVGVPLLCIAEENSELSSLVDRYQIGKCFSPDELQMMHDFIVELKNNTQKNMLFASNSLKASNDFGEVNINKFIENHV